MPATLVLGTTNRKKCAELADLLDLPDLQVRTLADFPERIDVVEDGDSFVANARKKAAEFALHLQQWVLADDSGLCVDHLHGGPGIYSARFAGEPCDDEANNDKLLASLAGVPTDQRGAYYVCAVALADPTGTIRAQTEGRCHGRIIEDRLGRNGFGYDPMFLIVERNLTFGELPPEYKRQHSHRAAAMRELRPDLIRLLQLNGQ